MSFKKWLYRKEIEQLKEDLFIFKCRYRIEVTFIDAYNLLNFLEKYLYTTCVDHDKFIEKISESNGKKYLDGYEFAVTSEEIFKEYFDPEKWGNAFSELSFNEFNENLKKIDNLEKEQIKLFKNIDYYVKKGIKNDSIFANTEDGQHYFGADDMNIGSLPLDSIESGYHFFLGLIKGIENTLRRLGCTKEEIESIDNLKLDL